MSWLENLLSALVGTPSGMPEPDRFAESAGSTVDADEDQWRRLSGDGLRDLAPMTQTRMQRLAHYMWESNNLANRLIELPIAYMLAEGVKWRIDDEAAQDDLDDHWNDGLNAWNIKLPKKLRELSMFGEQCYPVFRNEATGFVRLGYLDPSLIETVVTDPENIEQPIGIVTTKNAKGIARRYRIIVNVPETAFAERTREIRDTFTSGDCFYFRVNDLCTSTRGRSDLLPQIDWLDGYDQFLFGELDRAHLARAFVWDVELAGATPQDVEARAKKISAPRANSVRVHNESEKWEAKAPQLNAYDAGQAAKLFRNHMLGGATFPEHWYGGAENVNRATGDSMTEPTEKMLAMRQAYVGYALVQIGTYVLRSARGALDRELTKDEKKLLRTLRIEWPEMVSKDTTKYAAALQQVVSGCVAAIADGLLSKETALRLIASVAKRLGVEIDPEAELEAAEPPGGDIAQGDIVPPPNDGEPVDGE